MSFDIMDQKLPAYRGKPVSALVDRLGFPQNEATVMGRKAYTWTTAVGLHAGCTLRVLVDDQERILRWDYNGMNGPCFSYSDRL